MDNQNFNFDNIPTPRKPVFPPLDNANDNRINQVNMTENTNGNPAPNPEQSEIPYIPKSAFSQNYYNPEQNPANIGGDHQTAPVQNSETGNYPQNPQIPIQQSSVNVPYNMPYQMPYGNQSGTAPRQTVQQEYNSNMHGNMHGQIPDRTANSAGNNGGYGVNNYNNGNAYANPYTAPNMPAQNMSAANNPVVYPQPAKKSTGLKVFLICLCIVFVICLVGFVGMICYSLGQSSSGNTTDNISPTQYYGYASPTTPSVHNESDYSSKVNPDYPGLELQSVPSDSNSEKYNAEYSYNMVSKSVVGIVCYSGEITDVSQCTNQGSGTVISKDGYIVTNSHLINNSKTDYAIQVVTYDGKTYTAGVVGFDSRTDLAVLKADANDLVPAQFENSKDMQVGSGVIAIGNPGGIGYQNSLTRGVISAFDRTVASNTSVKYIQTDAAINPGNSGGPLCNMYGRVIGINTSKIVSEKYEGMCFAIPTETVKAITDDLIRQSYVKGRVRLGVVGVAVTAADRSAYGFPAGIMVENIDENGPLKDSGIQQYDIVTKINGESVANFGDIYTQLEKYKPGDKVTLEVYRSAVIAGEEKTFTADAVLAEDK